MPDITPAPPTATPAPVVAAPVVAAPVVAAPVVAAPVVAAPVVAAPVVAAPVVAAPGTVLTTPPGTTPPKEGTQDEPAKAPEVVAADIQIKVPEGVTVDQPTLDSFKAFAKENKLTSEVAQKFVDQFVSRQSVLTKETADRHMEQVTQWAEEARNDQEIGGAKFDATVTSAKKALQRFGSPDLDKILTSTGLGNNKAVIRTFAQIGKLISEDRLPGNNPGPSDSPMDPTAALYPTMQPK